MLRSFVGVHGSGAGRTDSGRLLAALEPEGPARLAELGSLALAHTGPPLGRAQGGAVCVLDGTLYELLGAPLPDGSGPEVEALLAEAWQREGDALLARLRGEFALLLFDPERGEGLLVRDQLGGRGAMWHAATAGTHFASEQRPLLEALPSRPGPDPVAVSHWLAVSGMPSDRSLHEGVRRIEAGCVLRLGRGPAVAHRYWEPRHDRPLKAGREECVAALREALERAVQRRIRPGERTGVLLSGGLDSGVVSAVGSRSGAGRRLTGAYSATFPGHPSVDESELIDSVTRELGLESTSVRVRGGSVVAGALEYVRRFELPPVSPNLFFWTPLLRRAAEDGTQVLLDGEGGDEIFGYSPQLLADRLRRGRVLSAAALVSQTPSGGGEAPRELVKLFLRAYAIKGAVPYWLHHAIRRVRSPQRYAPGWMRPEAAGAYSDTDDLYTWKRTPGPRWFADLVYRVTRGMGPALAYDHIRRRAALAGVEPRHPLVDVDLVELMLRLPPELAFHPRHSRPLLREAVEGLLPDSVRLRPTKSNFDALFHEALTGVDLPVVRVLLGRPDAEVWAWADRERVGALIADPPTRPHARMWWALHVWRLVTAELWLLGQRGPETLDRLLEGRLAPAQIELRPARAGSAAGC